VKSALHRHAVLSVVGHPLRSTLERQSVAHSAEYKHVFRSNRIWDLRCEEVDVSRLVGEAKATETKRIMERSAARAVNIVGGTTRMCALREIKANVKAEG
jgi:hypothetical protein